MDGVFTFRASADGQQSQRQRPPADANRSSSLVEDFDSPMHPWRSCAREPRPLDETDTVVESDDDCDHGSERNNRPQQQKERLGVHPHPSSSSRSSGQHVYHYHYHQHQHQHQHYHHGYTPRRRHMQAPASDAPSDAEPPVTDEQQEPPSMAAPDPLTWHSSNRGAGSLGPAGGANAWLSELLGAHGIGHEWTASSAADGEMTRRCSQRRSTLDSAGDGDDALDRLDAHWDDMLTFRQTRVRVPRERTWSGSSASSLNDGMAGGQPVRWRRLLPSASSAMGRLAWLTLLPVSIVVAWCAVPLQTDLVLGPDGTTKRRLNFWVFLFFYYGTYNAVALLLVTQIFRVYSLTWWPRAMSGVLANVASWVFTTALGALVHTMRTGIERNPLAWTALTLLTLLLPVLVSFASIQRHHRQSVRRRRPPSEAQPLVATATEWRTPASYTRFLWFCSSFLLWYAALGAGEYLAHVYISTLPHSTKDGFFYVYSWIATVNVLSMLASWVVATRIRSWPLQYIYTLYFFMTYFIFYRNLFSRLQNPEQVVFIQLGSSLWVVFIYPVRMARWVYRLMAFCCRWSDDYTYEMYVKQLGRTFFLRNLAENATMLGFLCWVTVLHFGPNRLHYPHFQFKPLDDEFNYKYSLTVRASIYVWVSELVASRIVRFLFRSIYKHDISAEAVHDFRRYPHAVPAMVLVTIHVLQNILFGMIRLSFS
ncbi:hypothetical protein LPJ64_005551 [Coemansia asiatica]|uniref:Uncharacterized protein n=1 Tax=Coemansia asiatica TaxID=1052880 RepID=A0A9W8CGB1_9FUNG|nr:hypothetical protein LPJ64_005551 [Coemansia asiatica]